MFLGLFLGLIIYMSWYSVWYTVGIRGMSVFRFFYLWKGLLSCFFLGIV